MRINQLPLAESDIVTIIAELQTAVAEIQLSAEVGNHQQTRVLSNQLLVLFNSLVYCLRFDRIDSQNRDSAISLNQASQQLVSRLKPVADIYRIKLDLVLGSYKSDTIEIEPEIFDYITQTLGFGLLSCLQNEPDSCLKVKVVSSSQPQLIFSNSNIDLLSSDFKRMAATGLKNKLNTMSSGIHSGILISNLICDRVGVEFSLFHQSGRGVSLRFRPSYQLSLIQGR